MIDTNDANKLNDFAFVQEETMSKTSALEQQYIFIVEERRKGHSYRDIAASLNAKGYSTTRQNLSKWLKARAKRLERYAKELTPHSKVTSVSVQPTIPVANQPNTGLPRGAPGSVAAALNDPESKAALLAEFDRYIEKTRMEDPFERILSRRH